MLLFKLNIDVGNVLKFWSSFTSVPVPGSPQLMTANANTPQSLSIFWMAEQKLQFIDVPNFCRSVPVINLMDFSHVIFNFWLQLVFLIFTPNSEQLVNERWFSTNLNIKNCCYRYDINMKDNVLKLHTWLLRVQCKSSVCTQCNPHCSWKKVANLFLA